MKKLLLVVALCLFAVPAHAQYQGGMPNGGWGLVWDWVKMKMRPAPQEARFYPGMPRATPKQVTPAGVGVVSGGSSTAGPARRKEKQEEPK